MTTTKATGHTAIPWRKWDRRDIDQGILITDQSGKVGVCRVIGESQTKEICGANADFIIRAAEHHEWLVRLLQEALPYVEEGERYNKPSRRGLSVRINNAIAAAEARA